MSGVENSEYSYGFVPLLLRVYGFRRGYRNTPFIHVRTLATLSNSVNRIEFTGFRPRYAVKGSSHRQRHSKNVQMYMLAVLSSSLATHSRRWRPVGSHISHTRQEPLAFQRSHAF